MPLYFQKYGPVMRVALGSELWVVVTGANELKHFSMMEETVARPNLKTLYEIYSFDKSLGETGKAH